MRTRVFLMVSALILSVLSFMPAGAEDENGILPDAVQGIKVSWTNHSTGVTYTVCVISESGQTCPLLTRT